MPASGFLHLTNLIPIYPLTYPFPHQDHCFSPSFISMLPRFFSFAPLGCLGSPSAPSAPSARSHQLSECTNLVWQQTVRLSFARLAWPKVICTSTPPNSTHACMQSTTSSDQGGGAMHSGRMQHMRQPCNDFAAGSISAEMADFMFQFW